LIKEFRDLLPEAERLHSAGYRPHQIVEQLGDMAHDLGYQRFTTGGAEGLKVVPDNAAIVLPSGEAIRFRTGAWEHVEATAMHTRDRPFDIDQEITVARRSAPTTIRREHGRGKVRLGTDTRGRVAHIEQDNGVEITFGITEAGFTALGGTAA
jgi:hypothetical protein